MAYDPKKKRPSTKSVDSVVDEIFGAEKSDGKSGKSLKHQQVKSKHLQRRKRQLLGLNPAIQLRRQR